MTREQARIKIDFLDFYLQKHENDYSEEEHTAMMMAIEALRSSEKPNKWIPVSQPPEKSGGYLVSMRCVTHDVVAIASYATDLHKVDEYDFPKHEAGWYNYDSEYGYYELDDVVAWMPSPEPYKASPTGGRK